MKISDLLIAAPGLCGATNLRRREDINRHIVEKELADPNSVYAHNEEDDEDPANRLEVLFTWDGCENEGRLDYIQRLSLLALIRHGVNEHGRTKHAALADELEPVLREEEADHPEIAEIYNVDYAAKGYWF